MALRWLALGVLFSALIACKPPEDPNYVDLDDPPGVIVPARDARNFYLDRVHTDARAFFTPRKSDVLKLQAGLDRFLRQEQLNDRDLPADFPERARKFSRHYVGIVVGGKRQIWGSFFGDPYQGWRRHAMVVFDGGYRYFELLYDPETGQFSQFGHNGLG